jgi:hypothetical protein
MFTHTHTHTHTPPTNLVHLDVVGLLASGEAGVVCGDEVEVSLEGGIAGRNLRLLVHLARAHLPEVELVQVLLLREAGRSQGHKGGEHEDLH